MAKKNAQLEREKNTEKLERKLAIDQFLNERRNS